MEQALNNQLNAELYSSYLYLAMAAHFESTSLKGFANWMTVQAQEELAHAMKFYNYIVERGGRVRLAAIAEPVAEWDSPLAVFQAVYAHEQKVTGLINDLMKLAREEQDNACEIFLQWFVTERRGRGVGGRGCAETQAHGRRSGRDVHARPRAGRSDVHTPCRRTGRMNLIWAVRESRLNG